MHQNVHYKKDEISNKCTSVICEKLHQCQFFSTLFISQGILHMAGLQFNTCCATRTIFRLDIRIDIDYLAILFPQYTDEAMTLVHINGPSVTPKKKDGQFRLQCQYKRWRHSGHLAFAYKQKWPNIISYIQLNVRMNLEVSFESTCGQTVWIIKVFPKVTTAISSGLP